MLCESQAVWDQWTFSVSQVYGGGGGAPCYGNHRLFGTSGHSVYPRYMEGGSMLWESQTVWDQWTFSVSQVHGGGLHVMGIIDCLGPVDIQCIPGTWGGAPCYGNHRLFGIRSNSIQLSLFPAHINITYNIDNVHIMCRKRGGQKTMLMNVHPQTLTVVNYEHKYYCL